MGTLEQINIKTKEVNLQSNYDPFFKDKTVPLYYNDTDFINFTFQEATSNIGYEIFLLINIPSTTDPDYQPKLFYVFRNGFNSLFSSILSLINTFSKVVKLLGLDKSRQRKGLISQADPLLFYIFLIVNSSLEYSDPHLPGPL